MDNPTHLQINDSIYAINTDFRAWIKYERLWLDDCVTLEAKTAHIFKIIFTDKIPPIELNALNMLMKFYACGVTYPKGKSKTDSETLYDFKVDEHKIKSSFMAQFNFNPWEHKYMHWWDFRACFNSLLGATFENAVKYRAMDLSEYKEKQLNEMQELKNFHKIWTKKEIRERKENERQESEFKKAYENRNIAEYLRNVNK